MGDPVSQNSKGHLLGHVADLGGTLKNPKHRGYQTHDMLPFHCDACDLVVLMCLHPAKSGGEQPVHQHPQRLQRDAETPPRAGGGTGRPPSTVTGAARSRKARIRGGSSRYSTSTRTILTVSAGGTYIRSAQRFEQLPRHSEALKEALTLFADLCNELSYDMEFLQGDVQILHNHVTAHSRTEFEDYPEPERRRNLLRLWLGTPGGAAAAAGVQRPVRPPEGRGTAGRGRRRAGNRVQGAAVSGVGAATPLSPGRSNEPRPSSFPRSRLCQNAIRARHGPPKSSFPRKRESRRGGAGKRRCSTPPPPLDSRFRGNDGLAFRTSKLAF